MSSQSGVLVLIKVGNGASPEVFTTVGGLQTSSMRLDNQVLNTSNITQETGNSCLPMPVLHRLLLAAVAFLLMQRQKKPYGGTLEETAIIIAECIEEHSISVEMVRKSLIGSGLAQVLEALSWLFAGVFGGAVAWEVVLRKQSVSITRNQLNELMCKFPDATEEHIP